MTENEIIARALSYYGIKNQVMMLAEETGELLQAASKILRATEAGDRSNLTELRRNLIEEIADVFILCEQMIYQYDIIDQEVLDIKEKKLKRLEERISHKKEEE